MPLPDSLVTPKDRPFARETFWVWITMARAASVRRKILSATNDPRVQTQKVCQRSAVRDLNETR